MDVEAQKGQRFTEKSYRLRTLFLTETSVGSAAVREFECDTSFVSFLILTSRGQMTTQNRRRLTLFCDLT